MSVHLNIFGKILIIGNIVGGAQGGNLLGCTNQKILCNPDLRHGLEFDCN